MFRYTISIELLGPHIPPMIPTHDEMQSMYMKKALNGNLWKQREQKEAISCVENRLFLVPSIHSDNGFP